MESATLRPEELLEKYYGMESDESCLRAACGGSCGESPALLKKSYEKYLGTCDFLIKLLQYMEILPENTEIDKYWIRAELRYINGRKSAER